MDRISRLKAQSFSEYSLFIAIVLIALIVMNVYVKRGLQGRYADVADMPTGYINATVGGVLAESNYVIPTQYEPYYVESTTNISAPIMTLGEEFQSGGLKNKVLSAASTTKFSSASAEGTDIFLDKP